MEDFKKIVRIGKGKTYGGRGYSIFCKIQYTEGRLSISGVEGPLQSGNCLGGCGQIDMHLRENLKDITLANNGWDRAMLKRFFDVWQEWHLNDMQSGSPAQMAFLKANPVTDRLNYFSAASAKLKDAGLNPDPNFTHEGKPYVYGSAWLRIEVPEDVLQFLRDLPGTDKKPAWV